MAELLEQAAAGTAPAVVLIEGDEYLARTGARELAAALVPEKDRGLNLLVLDAAAGAREIASHLVTVAMFAAPKAVVVEGGEAFAEEQGLSAPPEDLEVLVKAVERGLPPKTHLILVAESLPPKHALVRLAQEKGVHLKRRAERRGRTIDTLDISPLTAEALRPHGKKLARDAEVELKNRLGDDLRLIASELRKLALYAGERAQITREDVEAIVAPVREEEFFALAEAVGEGDTAKALQLFGDELRRKANASAVALPFLGGVASAVRKALADSARYAGSGERELGYNEFQAKLFPALEEELSAKKQKVPHPFAAWLGYKRSRRRPRAFWRRALVRCAEVDFELKDGADPRLSVERLLVEVCT